jgi:hypothetical protein
MKRTKEHPQGVLYSIIPEKATISLPKGLLFDPNKEDQTVTLFQFVKGSIHVRSMEEDLDREGWSKVNKEFSLPFAYERPPRTVAEAIERIYEEESDADKVIKELTMKEAERGKRLKNVIEREIHMLEEMVEKGTIIVKTL